MGLDVGELQFTLARGPRPEAIVCDIYMPDAPNKKYPGAQRELGWQFLFPASKKSVFVYIPQ